ncbi:MAG: hypothetical protein Q9160_005096 [Pyrenula sp. 1 TL-2023]
MPQLPVRNEMNAVEVLPSHDQPRSEMSHHTYRILALAYTPEDVHHPALASHEDVLKLIRLIRLNSRMTRKEITKVAFPCEAFKVTSSINEQQTAVDLALRVMTMVNYSGSGRGWNLLEAGLYQSPWRDDCSVGEFLSDCFPTTEHPELNDETGFAYLDIRRSLRANKLQKHAGFKFRGTNNIRRHLMLDRKINVVEIFHHTSFLKEHLRLTKDHSNEITFENCIRLYWNSAPPASVRSSRLDPDGAFPNWRQEISENPAFTRITSDRAVRSGLSAIGIDVDPEPGRA